MWSRNSFAACLLLALATSAFAQGASPAILGWDENGNLVSKTVGETTWTYVYDADDELREVRRDGLLLETYQYDAQGHRVRRSGAGGTVRYVWDGDYVLQTTDDFGNTISRFLYAGKRLVSIEHSTEGLGFYLFDGLGSVSAISKADGSIAARYGYDSWGNLTRNLGASSNSFLFTGHEFDEATGLYYAKGRYLDSELGRFLSEDSNPGNPLDPLSFHRYSYAASNPTRFVDPDGREAMEVSASGNVRDLDGNQLLQILVHQEGLGLKEASRIVVLSGLGDDIGADRTAALAPAIAAAGELTGILPAERALANPYVQGGLQVAGGVAEGSLSLAATGSGVGAVVAPILAIHSGDSIGTGIGTLVTGELNETKTHQKLRDLSSWLGADPDTANFAADMSEMAFVGAGSAAAFKSISAATRAAPNATLPAEIASRPPTSITITESSWGPGASFESLNENLAPRPPPFQPGTTSLAEFDIDRYGTFSNSTRVGDQLAGHEMLQNAWLRSHGYAERRGVGSASRGNPAVALSQELHSRVGLEQARLGLNDPANLRAMTAEQNIELNAKAMRNAGVPEEVVQTLTKEAEAHAAALATKPAKVSASPPH